MSKWLNNEWIAGIASQKSPSHWDVLTVCDQAREANRLRAGLEDLYRGLTETPLVVHSAATADRIRELLEGGE